MCSNIFTVSFNLFSYNDRKTEKKRMEEIVSGYFIPLTFINKRLKKEL